MSDFSPREIVSELDRFIVGQADAKRAVAIALRNRWRRLQLDERLREEVLPKNILMNRADRRRQDRDCPAACQARRRPVPQGGGDETRTEVGYVSAATLSRSCATSLVEIAIAQTREAGNVRTCRRVPSKRPRIGCLDALVGANAGASTKGTFRRKLRAGELNDKEIEIEVQASGGMPLLDIPGMPGAQMGAISIGDIFGKLGGGRTKTRRVNVRDSS